MEYEIIYDYITYKININTVWLLVIIAVLNYCFITTILYKLNTLNLWNFINGSYFYTIIDIFKFIMKIACKFYKCSTQSKKM